jgi:hypothetical protein
MVKPIIEIAVGAILAIMLCAGVVWLGRVSVHDIQKNKKTDVMDSNHVTNCYHGYIITPSGEQLRDKDGRGMPCS